MATSTIRDKSGRHLAVRAVPTRAETITVRVLLVILAFLVFVIAAGTIYALVMKPSRRLAVDSAKSGIRGESAEAFSVGDIPSDAPSEMDGSTAGTPIEGFASIGRLRLQTAGPESAAVVFSVTFPYDARDRFLSEEIAAREKDFRDLTSDFIASLTSDELHTLDEMTLKDELLSRYNGLLRLGRIETLYIQDFNIIP